MISIVRDFYVQSNTNNHLSHSVCSLLFATCAHITLKSIHMLLPMLNKKGEKFMNRLFKQIFESWWNLSFISKVLVKAFLKLRNAAGTRSRISEKERDRNATIKITRNGKGTHAFLSRSFSLQFSALKLNKNDRKSQSGFWYVNSNIFQFFEKLYIVIS